MTGQDFQDKLNEITTDLATDAKGRTVQIMFRNPDNTANVMSLSSSANGTIDADQLNPIQAVVDGLKVAADAYETNIQPVKTASAAFTAARVPHEAKSDAATAARVSLAADLDADANYQTAKANYDSARSAVSYVNARSEYSNLNLSENFSELTQAKGSYIAGANAGGGPPAEPTPTDGG